MTKKEAADAANLDAAKDAPSDAPEADLEHPALDADPRANTTADQNRIDFNDPAF